MGVKRKNTRENGRGEAESADGRLSWVEGVQSAGEKVWMQQMVMPTDASEVSEALRKQRGRGKTLKKEGLQKGCRESLLLVASCQRFSQHH